MGKSITDENEVEHPSFGLVSFHHQAGRVKRLFGSHIAEHDHTVALRIKRGALKRSNTGDRYSPGDDLIEVVLSAAQFAQLLTTMNVYSGTPCTITWFHGAVEEPPELPSEPANIRAEFRARMAGIAESLAQKTKTVLDLLPASLKKGTRREIEHAVQSMVTEVAANAPFFVEQFQEATDRAVTAAKAEIDAVVTTVVTMTGFEVLKKHFSGERMMPEIAAIEPLALPPAGDTTPTKPDDA